MNECALPCYPSPTITNIHSRTMGTADHTLPLGDWLLNCLCYLMGTFMFFHFLSIAYVISYKLSYSFKIWSIFHIIQWCSQTQFGRSPPVFYSTSFPYIRGTVCNYDVNFIRGRVVTAPGNSGSLYLENSDHDLKSNHRIIAFAIIFTETNHQFQSTCIVPAISGRIGSERFGTIASILPALNEVSGRLDEIVLSKLFVGAGRNLDFGYYFLHSSFVLIAGKFEKL